MDDQPDERAPVASGQRVRRDKVERAKQLRQTMTTAERALWDCLRANRLAGLHIRRQQIISGFIVDFYCHAARLIVELDGAVHRDQQEYDAARDEVLATRNLLILRIANTAVETNINTVLTQIQTTCQERIRP